MMKLFYLVFLVIISLNVFYVPHCFTDRFFAAGMLWVGMAVGVLTIVWRVVEKGKMWCTWESGIVCLILMGLGVWDMLERGMWQSGVYGGALVLLMAVVCNSGKRLSFFSVCWIFALMAGAEALMALGQFAGVLKNGMQWQAVGSFDNPAGLSAYIESFEYVSEPLYAALSLDETLSFARQSERGRKCCAENYNQAGKGPFRYSRPNQA